MRNTDPYGEVLINSVNIPGSLPLSMRLVVLVHEYVDSFGKETENACFGSIILVHLCSKLCAIRCLDC